MRGTSIGGRRFGLLMALNVVVIIMGAAALYLWLAGSNTLADAFIALAPFVVIVLLLGAASLTPAAGDKS